MSDRAPCVRCGQILHTGEGRVLVSFTAPELEQLANGAVDMRLRERLLCALGTIDPDLEEIARLS